MSEHFANEAERIERGGNWSEAAKAWDDAALAAHDAWRRAACRARCRRKQAIAQLQRQPWSFGANAALTEMGR